MNIIKLKFNIKDNFFFNVYLKLQLIDWLKIDYISKSIKYHYHHFIDSIVATPLI